MQNIRIVLITTVLSLFSLYGFSQTVNKRTITIGGVTLNNSYTFAQFTSIMGMPSSYTSEPGDGGEQIIMNYNTNSFTLLANKFVLFNLINNSYKLNGVVGVGDPISNINLLNPFKLTSKLKGTNQMIYYAYITDSSGDMSPIYVYTTNGIITRIFYLDDI